MTKPTIADAGWLEFLIRDHLEPTLEAARLTLSDLGNLSICDAAGCGMTFDTRDKRGYVGHRGDMTVCPACECEYDTAKARAALAKAEAWERQHPPGEKIIPLGPPALFGARGDHDD